MSIQGNQDITNIIINVGKPVIKDLSLTNYDAFDGFDQSGLYSYQQEAIDDPYDSVRWDGNLSPATKNSIRDKIESLTLTGNTIINNGSGFSGYIDASQPKYAFQQGADVSSGFQTAINDAISSYKTLRLPPGTYNLSRTIRILQPTSGQNFLNLEGDTTTFNWTGASTGVILESSNSFYFHYKGFSITNNGAGGRGSLTGIFLTGPNFNGTQNVGGIYENILVNNCHIGFQAGGEVAGKAASEQLYLSCKFSNCNIGWTTTDYNTLDHTFVMLLMNDNLTGLNPGFCPIQVLGGSASSNGVDFNFSSFAPQSIVGFRTELGNRFAHINKGNVNITSCQIHVATGAEAIHIRDYGQVTLQNNQIEGKVSWNPFHTSYLHMYNNHLTDNGSGLPFTCSGAAVLYATYDVRNNQKYLNNDINTVGFSYEDGAGSWQYGHHIKEYSKDGFNRFYSQNVSQRYSRVTSIGQGTGLGSNLRLQAKFNNTGVCNVLFQNSCNINIANSHTINITGGSFQLISGDIGKRVYIPTGAFVSDSNLDQSGYISRVNSTGQFYMIPRPDATRNNIACVIGQNEPDINYFLSLSPNVQETISWSNKTITGFTLTSSNTGSNALVDIILLR